MYARRKVSALSAKESRLGVIAWGCPPIGPIQSFMSFSEIIRMLGGVGVLSVGGLQEARGMLSKSTKSRYRTGIDHERDGCEGP